MSACPCGTGTPYDACCAPLHRGERDAVTAEELMRSRYSAFVTGDLTYLLATWDDTTRPASLTAPDIEWTRLRILATDAGGPGDTTGEVTFRAHFRHDGEPDALTEHSIFRRGRDGRWRYLRGV